MAYMFTIQTTCHKDGCRKPQTHRVCNNVNDTMGTYCQKHAKERLKSLQDTEKRLAQLARGA